MWEVTFSRKVKKSIKSIPERIKYQLFTLIKEIESQGPVRGNWPNYSKLNKNKHHCHLNPKGKPTYVAVWETLDKEIRIVEVIYVGTHEKAPY